MAERRPLVMINGKQQELPTEDNLPASALPEGGGAGLTSAVDIQIFDTAGTYEWTKPAGAKWVEVWICGGGGGGGSGRCGATGAANVGGGGGSSSPAVSCSINPSLLGESVAVTIGAGGEGGASRPSTNNGLAGSVGGVSKFGNYLQAQGGNAGAGGQVSGGGGGGSDSVMSMPIGNYFPGDRGQAASSSGGSAGTAYRIAVRLGGGAGGGTSTSDVAGQGGRSGVAGGSSIIPNASGTSYEAAPAAAAGENGAIGVQYGFHAFFVIGGGGGGGSTTGNAGNGGNGIRGGGGGGGGASHNGVGSSGAGGNGGDGYCIVITYL